ncbi:MAG: hypothetical protein ACLFUU_06235 [Desulfobacteraceae bacterium]
MAITTCRECQKEVSTEAQSCPYCGAPHPAEKEWRGTGYEWKSARSYCGYPLVHIAFGKNAQGRRRVAKGIIAIGQIGIGVITVAQFGVGIVFGFGQFIFAPLVVAQLAGGLILAVGQIACGYVAIGQFVLAYYGLACAAVGKYIWTLDCHDAEAVEFFRSLWMLLKHLVRF